jgi:hypothetical protein
MPCLEKRIDDSVIPVFERISIEKIASGKDVETIKRLLVTEAIDVWGLAYHAIEHSVRKQRFQEPANNVKLPSKAKNVSRFIDWTLANTLVGESVSCAEK